MESAGEIHCLDRCLWDDFFKYDMPAHKIVGMASYLPTCGLLIFMVNLGKSTVRPMDGMGLVVCVYTTPPPPKFNSEFTPEKLPKTPIGSKSDAPMSSLILWMTFFVVW